MSGKKKKIGVDEMAKARAGKRESDESGRATDACIIFSLTLLGFTFFLLFFFISPFPPLCVLVASLLLLVELCFLSFSSLSCFRNGFVHHLNT